MAMVAKPDHGERHAGDLSPRAAGDPVIRAHGSTPA